MPKPVPQWRQGLLCFWFDLRLMAREFRRLWLLLVVSWGAAAAAGLCGLCMTGMIWLVLHVEPEAGVVIVVEDAQTREAWSPRLAYGLWIREEALELSQYVHANIHVPESGVFADEWVVTGRLTEPDLVAVTAFQRHLRESELDFPRSPELPYNFSMLLIRRLARQVVGEIVSLLPLMVAVALVSGASAGQSLSATIVGQRELRSSSLTRAVGTSATTLWIKDVLTLMTMNTVLLGPWAAAAGAVIATALGAFLPMSQVASGALLLAGCRASGLAIGLLAGSIVDRTTPGSLGAVGAAGLVLLGLVAAADSAVTPWLPVAGLIAIARGTPVSTAAILWVQLCYASISVAGACALSSLGEPILHVARRRLAITPTPRVAPTRRPARPGAPTYRGRRTGWARATLLVGEFEAKTSEPPWAWALLSAAAFFAAYLAFSRQNFTGVGLLETPLSLRPTVALLSDDVDQAEVFANVLDRYGYRLVQAGAAAEVVAEVEQGEVFTRGADLDLVNAVGLLLQVSLRDQALDEWLPAPPRLVDTNGEPAATVDLRLLKPPEAPVEPRLMGLAWVLLLATKFAGATLGDAAAVAMRAPFTTVLLMSVRPGARLVATVLGAALVRGALTAVVYSLVAVAWWPPEPAGGLGFPLGVILLALVGGVAIGVGQCGLAIVLDRRFQIHPVWRGAAMLGLDGLVLLTLALGAPAWLPQAGLAALLEAPLGWAMGVGLAAQIGFAALVMAWAMWSVGREPG